MKNSETFNSDLYSLLRTRGYKPVPLDTSNQRVPTPETASVIQATFIKDDKEFGKFWVSIDDSQNLIVYYDNEQQDSPTNQSPGLQYNDTWTGFLKNLKSWAMNRQLSFELLNQDRLSDDMKQREFYKMKEKMSESERPKKPVVEVKANQTMGYANGTTEQRRYSDLKSKMKNMSLRHLKDTHSEEVDGKNYSPIVSLLSKEIKKREKMLESSDYPKKKLGQGNPYYGCAECGRSDPEINGDSKKHEKYCSYYKDNSRPTKVIKMNETVAGPIKDQEDRVERAKVMRQKSSTTQSKNVKPSPKENLKEVSKDLLSRYVDDARDEKSVATHKANRAEMMGKDSTRFTKHAEKRTAGIKKATDKISKATSSKLDEVGDTPAGKNILRNYVKDAKDDLGVASYENGRIDHQSTGKKFDRPSVQARLNKNYKQQNKRSTGIDRAVDRLTKVDESYHPMGKKASYNDAVPNVKIVLQHSRALEEGEQRYRNIERIFLENESGERFLAPTNRPGIAKVYARHIAEGGNFNDERWNHIKSLCEEYKQMANFVRATKHKQFTNESAQSLVNEGVGHYNSLRETLSRMTGHRGYSAYFESWTPTLMENDGDDISSVNDMFVQESTIDPRIESVIPILSRIHKKVNEMNETKEFDSWADSVVNEHMQELDEVGDTPAGKNILRNYVKNAKDDLGVASYENGRIDHQSTGKKFDRPSVQARLNKNYKQQNKRSTGIDRAVDRLTNLDETSTLDVDSGKKLLRQYLRNEARNYHSDNILLLAKNFGTEEDVRQAEELVAKQEELGHFPDRYRAIAYDINKRLYPKLAVFDKTVDEEKEPWMGQDLETPSYIRKQKYDDAKKDAELGGPMLRREKDNPEEVDEGEIGSALGGVAGELLAPEIPGSGMVGARLGSAIQDNYVYNPGSADSTEDDEEVDEGLDANQKRVGQLGPTTPVGKNEKNLRGKLVGCESIDPELARIKKLSGL